MYNEETIRKQRIYIKQFTVHVTDDEDDDLFSIKPWTKFFTKVRQLVNNFEFDFSPETVTLEELKSHAIELGGIRSEYRKKVRSEYRLTVFNFLP